jgi:hypothetical protein
MTINDNPEDWNCVYGFQDGLNSTNIVDAQRAHDLGLHPYDVSMFQAIHYDYGQVTTREELACVSFIAPSSSIAETAVERCFRQGWIHVVTPEFEQELRDELRTGGYVLVAGLFDREKLREIRGESVAGIISFTRQGAEIWKQWMGYNGGGEWVVGYDEEQAPAAYGINVSEVKDGFEQVWEHASFNHPFTRSGLTAVGRWCNRWWRRFETGFKISYSCVSTYDEEEARLAWLSRVVRRD